ncbi:TPA: hypothetical protein NNT57_004637 [Salmonella enterica]|uniref:Uncharacterized protein n=3 Tax=Lokivirus IMEAB3 TaxID=2560266 RepID=A0A873WEV9_9CAUD|nr:hypothetical protein CH11_gp56 [Acinetobacter phage IMEAB3]QBG78714.1 hypothetical protein vBAbaSD0_20 [Acinetobacter phage vB_AbaS_D0]QPB10400.1 hypothetical protein AbSZ3_35 [Acinetobacter phage Ab_SZ3]WUU86612.1 hypothetical protein [Acinetobacter phage vB_AbaSi_W9]HCH8772103.1 hypothetical protein [Salmonella enterica]AHI60055.1 hypothetical protein IME_AB3_56 [Acinetobacter phage IMEAB3]
MYVSNFLIDGSAFKVAVQNDGVFVKGEQKATFNGIYCCSNTWRHIGEADEGANVIKVVKDGVKHELFFSYTHYRNGRDQLPVSELTLVNLNGGFSPQFPFNYEKSNR